MPISKQWTPFLLASHLNTDDWKCYPNIHTDTSLSRTFTTTVFSWKIGCVRHWSQLLSEVDNIFSRFQYHLLAILSLTNNRSHHTVRVSVSVHAAMPQPSRPMWERLTAEFTAERLGAVVLHAVRPCWRQVEEALATEVAAVASVFVVDRGAVAAHCRDVRETARALGTLVRTFTRVNWHVLL